MMKIINESFWDVRDRMTGDMTSALQSLNYDIKLKMGNNPQKTPENDKLFEGFLLRVEAEYGLAFYETYLVGRQANYPTDWTDWRTMAGGKYRKSFEKLRENTMKRDEIKQLIRQIIKEDHGMGFSHNVSLPQDANTMNKPTIKEYGDHNSRARAIESSDSERGMALLYKWSESGVVDFKEFRFLLMHLIQKSK